MAATYMDLGRKSELVASAVQEYLRSLASKPEPVWGRSRLHLVQWAFDAYHIDDAPFGLGVQISPRINEWVDSEIGKWALTNVPGIEVNGMYDVTIDHVRLMVSARVDDTIMVEHSMRWG